MSEVRSLLATRRSSPLTGGISLHQTRPPTLRKTTCPIDICGNVDSGMNTTTGHQLYELGGIPEREPERLTKKRKALKNHPSRLLSTWTGAKRRRYEM